MQWNGLEQTDIYNMSNESLKGKVAIITGSSMGIGKAIAWEFANKGASVVLNARNKEKLAKSSTLINIGYF